MKLIANECVQCKRPIGYLTPTALQIPTICVLCAGDPETMEEWGHDLDVREKPIKQVLQDYRSTLNHMDLK